MTFSDKISADLEASRGAFRRWRSSQCPCCSVGNYTRGTEIGRCLLNSYQIKLRRKCRLTAQCSNPAIQPPSPTSSAHPATLQSHQSSSTGQFLLIHLSAPSLAFPSSVLHSPLCCYSSLHTGCLVNPPTHTHKHSCFSPLSFSFHFAKPLEVCSIFFIGFSDCLTLTKARVCVLFNQSTVNTALLSLVTPPQLCSYHRPVFVLTWPLAVPLAIFPSHDNPFHFFLHLSLCIQRCYQFYLLQMP